MRSSLGWIGSVPNALWAPFAVGLLTLVPGVIGLATGRLLLFPSLGPTALLQVYSPEQPSSRFYNVVVGHLGGLLCGYAVVFLFGIAYAPSVFELHQLSTARLGAAVVAVMLATWLEWLLRAKHAPAASTTLLVALGSFKPTLPDTAAVVLGVLSIAATGEMLRRLRLRSQQQDSRKNA